MLKSKDFKYVENEILAVKNEVGNRVLKVIIETCYLTDEEKKVACKLAMNAFIANLQATFFSSSVK